MTNLIRSIVSPCASPDSDDAPGDAERVREWIITNGLGGYASGTVCGVPTRRYHGLLIAALPAPLGRTMMLNQLLERVVLPDGGTIDLEGEALAGRPAHPAEGRVAEFRLEAGLPVWRFDVAGITLEKRLLIPHLQNTVYVSYRMLDGGTGAGGPIQLQLRPLVHIRSHDAPVSTPHFGPYRFTAWGDRYEVSAGPGIPPLRMTLRGGDGSAFTLDAARTAELLFRLEAQRGYESKGDQWSPGYFHVAVAGEESVTLVASAEDWETLLAMPFDEALRAERRRRSRLLTIARRVARARRVRQPEPRPALANPQGSRPGPIAVSTPSSCWPPTSS